MDGACVQALSTVEQCFAPQPARRLLAASVARHSLAISLTELRNAVLKLRKTSKPLRATCVMEDMHEALAEVRV